jgi:hypothetical protein
MHIWVWWKWFNFGSWLLVENIIPKCNVHIVLFKDNKTLINQHLFCDLYVGIAYFPLHRGDFTKYYVSIVQKSWTLTIQMWNYNVTIKDEGVQTRYKEPMCLLCY